MFSCMDILDIDLAFCGIVISGLNVYEVDLSWSVSVPKYSDLGVKWAIYQRGRFLPHVQNEVTSSIAKKKQDKEGIDSLIPFIRKQLIIQSIYNVFHIKQ